MYNARIAAIAHHVPERVVTNFDLEKHLDTSDEWIRTRTGILERRMVAPGEATSDLAAAAAGEALKQCGVRPEEIDCIVLATVTPDMFFPSTACLLQQKIAAWNAWGFDLSGACTGFIYALATGAQFIHSGAHRNVLVVGADVMSSILNPRDRSTYVLFGDGAGAALIVPAEAGEPGILDFILRSDGSGADFLYMPAGGSRRPASQETVRQNLHYVHQDGRAVFRAAVQGMVDVAAEILARNGLEADDLALLIPHQANLRIIDAMAERLGIDPTRVVRNIDRYANTTAATIPIGLSEAHQRGLLKKGDLVLLVSFGAGFTSGSLLLRWLP